MEKIKEFYQTLENLITEKDVVKNVFEHVTRTFTSAGIITIGLWTISFFDSEKTSGLVLLSSIIICGIGTVLLTINLLSGSFKIKSLKIADGQKTLLTILYSISYAAIVLLLLLRALTVDS